MKWMISGQRQAIARGQASTVSMARYLPITTAVTEAGAVSSSWSVRLRRSSAMERMVRMGTSTIRTKSVAPRAVEK